VVIVRKAGGGSVQCLLISAHNDSTDDHRPGFINHEVKYSLCHFHLLIEIEDVKEQRDINNTELASQLSD
jgi:hypothetical protein